MCDALATCHVKRVAERERARAEDEAARTRREQVVGGGADELRARDERAAGRHEVVGAGGAERGEREQRQRFAASAPRGVSRASASSTRDAAANSQRAVGETIALRKAARARVEEGDERRVHRRRHAPRAHLSRRRQHTRARARLLARACSHVRPLHAPSSCERPPQVAATSSHGDTLTTRGRRRRCRRD